MRGIGVMAFVVALAATAGVTAQEAPGQAEETVEAAVDPAVDPAVAELLAQVEAKGEELKTFQARMTYRQEQLLLDTVTLRNGWLAYEAGEDAVRFRIHFADWLQQDMEQDEPGKPLKFGEDFAFDGRWLVRRNERTKTLQRVEVTRTPRNREDFRLGQGPFPLPFALKKEDVLEEFGVELIEPEEPTKSHYLVLTPKPESQFSQQYVQLELWLDKATLAPVRIRYETDDAERIEVTWSKVELDKSIGRGRFELQPAGADWDIEVIPLPKEEEGKNES